ncbi:response regulator transcription factor [Streptomyces sp. NPDC088180]|uniref:response regulator transcription factor n=1 Tax=Streptomyces sp. NPDC088180 TaxID=3365837 RepID=UPI00381B9B1A
MHASVPLPSPFHRPRSPHHEVRAVPAGSWRILVVDSDERSARDLTHRLQRHRHDARAVTTGAAALREHTDADVVLLDLDLPDIDGLEICRSIATTSGTPVLAVTAHGSELGCVLGLQAGADDYVVKPYGFRELLARVDAVMRRARPKPEAPMSMQVGSLFIERTTRTVVLHGRVVPLTRKEFDLLQLLASPPGEVVPRRSILQRVWQDTDMTRSRTIDTHITSLRRKLGSPDWILTVRGVGFRLVPR